MTAMQWLLVFALVVTGVWVLGLAADAVGGLVWRAWWLVHVKAEAFLGGRHLRRSPVTQPARVTRPPLPLPPEWGHADLRYTRPEPAGPGRHRRPEGLK